MEEPPQNHPPIVRSGEAVRDIDAAVDLIGKRTGVSRVSLFGWATGGQWAGYYATLYSEKLSHLILLNALYGADAPHPVMGHGSEMEDPAHPGHLNPAIGAYRCSSADSLLGAWNRSIPNEHRARWRDPGLRMRMLAKLWQATPRRSLTSHRAFDPRTVRLRIAST